MKLSIAWIFDHIDADWKKVDIHALVDRFNQTTAEIEGWHKIHINPDPFLCVQIKTIKEECVVAFDPENNTTYELPLRQDVHKGAWFFIVREEQSIRWAQATDWASTRDILIPAVYADSAIKNGTWRQSFEIHDYIIEVDNKSITHRPDMWGHRGFAREIAAMLELPLRPLHKLLATIELSTTEKSNGIAIAIDDAKACSRFSGIYVACKENRPSSLWMMQRLLCIDARPINALVDATNYTMFDIGYPMHAFDADKIQGKLLTVRQAKNKEKLQALDGDTLELTSDDVIIADERGAISLAGVMGGASTAISSESTHIFFEAACFEAALIRRSALRHKKRTEASSRFEKSLDATATVYALQRCLQLLRHMKLIREVGTLASIGQPPAPIIIEVLHAYIEQCLGVTIDPQFVIKTLKQLEFVVKKRGSKKALIYQITVPTFRATKDIRIKEDIVEEIGRFFGYNTIPPVLPTLVSQPKDMHGIYRVRFIRQICAYALSMHEIYTYALYDESFLRTIAWEPKNAVAIKNPVSENRQRLVTSLVPHLLQAVEHNANDYDQLRFFEWARIWQQQEDNIIEKKSLAGIMYDKKNAINFYEAKASLMTLLDAIKLPVTWAVADGVLDPWYMRYQTAYILHEGKQIGIAGIVDQTVAQRFCTGFACIFEFDGDFMLQYRAEIHPIIPLPKYPAITRDISMLVPIQVTAAQIITCIQDLDQRIEQVDLIDFFEKKEWQDQKSLTVRFVVRDETKTLTKEEVDTIATMAVQALQLFGAVIR